MAAARTFHIRPVLHGQPLGAALKRLLPKQPPAELRRLVRERHVQLNGNVVVDEGRTLKGGDVVKVFEHAQAAPASAADARIRYMDEHLVVVEKPAGVTTMRQHDEGGRTGRRRDRMATLEEMLQRVVAQRFQSVRVHGPAARAPQTKAARHPLARRSAPPIPAKRNQHHPGHRPPQVRPVHRLDRDTSGLMIFALSPEAELALTQMFREHTIDRTYLAVVHGHPAAQTIESQFVRDRGDGLRGSSPLGSAAPGAQHAITHVKPLEYVGDYAVIECRLQTGRTHQIRIHLAEIGHMLCGEKTYTRTAPTSHSTPDHSASPRQALHSHHLSFTHPLTHQPLHFTSPLPPDLSQWLHRLRRTAKP